jgi:hypothetical protein
VSLSREATDTAASMTPERAGLPVDLLPEQELAIRGRAEPMIVRVVTNARMLSSPRIAIVA